MIAGIASVVLFTAALLMVPTLPGIDKPGYDIVSHVSEHSGAMRMQALVLAFGSLALVVVLRARDRLTGPSSYVFTIGSASCTRRASSRRGSPPGSRCIHLPGIGDGAHHHRHRCDVRTNPDSCRHHGRRANPIGGQ